MIGLQRREKNNPVFRLLHVAVTYQGDEGSSPGRATLATSFLTDQSTGCSIGVQGRARDLTSRMKKLRYGRLWCVQIF